MPLIYFFIPLSNTMHDPDTPIALDQVADQLERLLLRYEEVQKANTLLQAQLDEATQTSDSLRSRLSAARTRIDGLLNQLQPSNLTAPAAESRPELPIEPSSDTL